MQLLPKLPPKSSGAHQFFSYMIYHVNHVFVFTVVVLIILKYITPQNGLCHYLKITVLRNLHAKTSQRHLSNFFPQFPRPTESSRTESSRYGIFAKGIFAIGIFAIRNLRDRRFARNISAKRQILIFRILAKTGLGNSRKFGKKRKKNPKLFQKNSIPTNPEEPTQDLFQGPLHQHNTWCHPNQDVYHQIYP